MHDNKNLEICRGEIQHNTQKTANFVGVDLPAKTDQVLFTHLLMQAKCLANEGLVTIVLVSSEGARYQ